MTSFSIHSDLASSCHNLGRLQLSHVLLNHNALIPWFILVPEVSATNLLDLEADVLNKIMAECQHINQFLVSNCGYTKTNIASLGNQTPQLHIHIVGRKPSDVCWPQPIWGNLHQHQDYDADTLHHYQQQLLDP